MTPTSTHPHDRSSSRRYRIYVASSWRCEHYPSIVEALRADGHDVFDFRNPPHGRGGLSWSEIDPNWQRWTPKQYCHGIGHPIAQHAFDTDMDGLRDAEVCVLVQPCGRSAHLELGYAAGAGKHTAVLLADGQEPELMLKVAELLTPDLDELRAWLAKGCPPF